MYSTLYPRFHYPGQFVCPTDSLHLLPCHPKKALSHHQSPGFSHADRYGSWLLVQSDHPAAHHCVIGSPSTLATSRCCQCSCISMCQGWRVPSLHRPIGDGVPPGSGCTPAHPPTPLPHPPTPLSGCPLLVAQRRWSWFFVGMLVSFRRVRSPSSFPQLASMYYLPSRTHAYSFASQSSPLLCLIPLLSAARPVGSGERHWPTAPDINRTRRRKRPCGTHIAQSCTLTWAHIHSRRQQQDKTVVLAPWCEPPEPSPPPSPPFTPRS